MPEPRACDDLELTGDRLNSLNLSDRIQEFTKGTQKWLFTHEADDRNADRLDAKLAEAQATAESGLDRLRRKLREA